MHAGCKKQLELCYNTLIEEGEKAMLVAEQLMCRHSRRCRNALSKPIPIWSGVGFESGGLAGSACHSLTRDGSDAHHFYHGEKVAFGTLTQLVLENAPVEEIETVAGQLCSVDC